MVGPGADTAHAHKKKESPEDRANFPFSGEEETDQPHQDGVPTRFVSPFLFSAKSGTGR